MKNLTKILSMVLLVAMCMSMLTVSAFADGEEHNCADYAKVIQAGVYHAPVAATCTEDGNIAYYSCAKEGCPHCYADAACTEYLGSIVDPATGHGNYTEVEREDPTCVDAGWVAHKICGNCGETVSEDGSEVIDPTLAATGKHSFVEISRTPASETAEGSIQYECKVCGETDEETIDKLPSTTPAFAVTAIGSTTYESADDVFRFQVNDPDAYEVTKVTANGKSVEFELTKSGKVIIDASEVSSISDPTIDLVFYLADGTGYAGLYISKPDKLEVDELQITYLTQNKYVKESGKPVSFQTTDSNPDNVKIFFGNTQLDVPDWGYTFEAAYGEKYTYLFDNDYLDSLDCGTYQIRCYYGPKNADYKTPGTLTISDPNTTEGLEEILYFTNSTQGDDEYFKYVSGDEVPRMYCQLFLVDGARLQVSTNGGKSWSNVGVYNYMIELSNGNETSHAWIGSDYLDSLNADTIYYFRVVVPAKAANSNQDLVSNTVSITTGPTLKAVDTAKHVINSSKNLKFVCSDEIAKVYVGNVQLTDEDDFYVSKDGKTVTLTAEFLNKRTAGSTYTIKVLTESGEYASTTFQILTTAQASASPRTGDTSNIGLWTAVLMLSAGAGVAILPRLKKD